MPDTPDKGTEQAADAGDKTATAQQGDASEAKAPDSQSLLRELELKLQKAQEEAKSWQGRYGNAERKIRQQGDELGKYRQYFRDSTGEVETPSQGDTSGSEMTQAMFERASWVMLVQDRPEAAKMKSQVLELMKDPDVSSRLDHPDPYVKYGNYVDYLEKQAQVEELERLRNLEKKINDNRERIAAGAIVSGGSASEPTEVIDMKEVDKMTSEEMEKRFPKSMLLGGAFRR